MNKIALTQPDVSFISSLLPIAGVMFVIAVGVIALYSHFRKNLYRQTLEREELKTKHQFDLLQANIETQEKERKRVAQNLHDELGAVLSIIRMQLVQLEQQHSTDTKLHTSLNRVRLATEAALTSMRNLSYELMPPRLEEFGLIKTLQEFIDELNDSGKIKGQLHAGINIARLTPSAELSLYRLCMELINNTIKHSQAEFLSIQLLKRPSLFQLLYSDNGKGVQKNFIAGHGLKNMEARISALGGTLSWGNSNNGGFYAKAEIPLVEN